VNRHGGQRCLVTGGASGIGAAMAARFAAEGARVAVLDLRDPQAAATPDGPAAELAIRGDVARHDDVARAFGELERRWGGVDLVLNNAGVSVREGCLEVTAASWQRVLDVNLTGAFFVAQAAARLMRATTGRGVIINTASVSGLVGMPNYVSYNVSKAGVIEMTRTMALELAPGIRVNAICPGYVVTPMQRAEHGDERIAAQAAALPLRRLGLPEEIAGLASFLASPDAAFATGASFIVDGGETAGGLASA
jgi:NAD(P)-dependent dehydrogenase (short-subunit alcohol dehydrogenase family)